MITPMITDITDANSTAPAAISFTFPAKGFLSAVTRSTRLSTALFIISNAITRAMHRTTIHHSIRVIPKYNPAAITSKAIMKCTFRLNCSANEARIPLKA